MYLALVYDVADDYLERRAAFRDEHLALARAAHEHGELLMGGAMLEPLGGALLVWSTQDRGVVERFVEQDPYVRNGVVTAWRIHEWHVVVGDAAQPSS